MSHFWSGTLVGITRTGAGFTGGITGNTTYTLNSGIFTSKANGAMWDGGVFGVSVTTFNGVNFSVHVVGDLNGLTVPIAGISGIGSTTTTLIPFINEIAIGTAAGTTQNVTVRIPTPKSIVFGNSAIVGKSYSAVVYGMLYRNAL